MKTVKQIRDESYEVYTCCGTCAHCKWGIDDSYHCYLVEEDPLEVDVCGTCDLWEGC